MEPRANALRKLFGANFEIVFQSNNIKLVSKFYSFPKSLLFIADSR